jgi:hypothetical protein
MTLTWFYFKLVMSSRILICTILAYNIWCLSICWNLILS